MMEEVVTSVTRVTDIMAQTMTGVGEAERRRRANQASWGINGPSNPTERRFG